MREFAALGSEAFIPATDIGSLALFTVQSLDTGSVLFEAGARIERQTLDQVSGGCDRSDTSWSAAWKISDADSQRGTVLAVLTTLWGVRLGGYLWWRNHGKGEDFRYQAMRKHYGSKFALKSLFIVFGLQGALMWVVSLPVQLGQMTNNAKIGVVGVIGIVVWAIGFLFESVGDIASHSVLHGTLKSRCHPSF